MIVDGFYHPLGFDIGTEPYINTHVGVVVGDIALVGGATGLHGLLALKLGAGKVAFPSRSVAVLLYFFQTIVTSSLIVFFYTGSRSWRAVGAIALLIAAGPVCAIAYQTTGARFTATYIPYASLQAGTAIAPGHKGPAYKEYLRRFLVFVTGKDGEWKDSDGSPPGFCKKYSAYFKSYVAGFQNLLLAEFFLSLLFAALDFQIVQSNNHCQALNGVLFGLLFLYLCFLLYFRPLCKPFDFKLTLASSFLQVVTAFVAFIMSALNTSSGSASRALEKVASVSLLLSSVVFFVKTATTSLSRAQSIHAWVQKKLDKKKSKGSQSSGCLQSIRVWLQKKFGKRQTKVFDSNAPPVDAIDHVDARQGPGDIDIISLLSEEMLTRPMFKTTSLSSEPLNPPHNSPRRLSI